MLWYMTDKFWSKELKVVQQTMIICRMFKIENDKKVLLRERKRHTARRVVSTPSVVLPGYPPGGGTWSGTPLGVPGQVPPQGYPDPRGGYPVRYTPGGVPGPPWGVPSQVPPRGYPVRYPPGGSGYPLGGSGYPPGGVPDRVPPAASWHSGKCCKALWDMGTPPVDRQIDGWTDACQNITFPRTTYAGGKNIRT